MHTNDALRVEIDREINGLKEMEVGSEKLSAAVNDVTKLIDRKIEMDRAETEAYEKAEERKAERLHRYIGYGITIGTTVLGTIVTVSCFHKSMEFEKTGTITTLVGKIMHSRPFNKK
jgi:hypothetical protein